MDWKTLKVPFSFSYLKKKKSKKLLKSYNYVLLNPALRSHSKSKYLESLWQKSKALW